MTLIAAAGFSDEVIVISDSRVSYLNNAKPPRDNLRKIFQITSHSIIGFTTANVIFTQKILEELEKFLRTIDRSKDPAELFKIITHYNKGIYRKLVKKYSIQPEVGFVLAGMTNKRYKVKATKLSYLFHLHRNKPFFPKKLSMINLHGRKGYVDIPTPNPILVKQHFPDMKLTSTIGWDYTAVGSGKDFIEEIEKFYNKIFFVDTGLNKGIILSDLAENFIKKSKINTIGGIIQPFMINKDGVQPLMYEAKVNGRSINRKYLDVDGNWIEEDDNGNKKIVKQELEG